jgi:hypothetical protein
MTIRIEGKIAVKSVAGRNGNFSVGDLTTGIGDFKVVDAILDQFEPGTYEGVFLVEQIYPSSWTWRGKVMIEVRAKLADIILSTHSEVVVPTAEAPEPDPIVEQRSPVRMPPIVQLPTVFVTPDGEMLEQPESQSKQIDDLVNKLFGADPETLETVRSGGQPITLDPTIDRELFRQQRDYLKANGYKFDPIAQTWLNK